MRIKSYTAMLLLSFLLASPAWAQSKSTTINVSCSIAPRVQLSSRGVETNLQKNFSTLETYEKRSSGYTKVLSVTAL